MTRNAERWSLGISVLALAVALGTSIMLRERMGPDRVGPDEIALDENILGNHESDRFEQLVPGTFIWDPADSGFVVPIKNWPQIKRRYLCTEAHADTVSSDTLTGDVWATSDISVSSIMESFGPDPCSDEAIDNLRTFDIVGVLSEPAFETVHCWLRYADGATKVDTLTFSFRSDRTDYLVEVSTRLVQTREQHP